MYIILPFQKMKWNWFTKIRWKEKSSSTSYFFFNWIKCTYISS